MLKARDRDSPKAQVGFLLGHSGVYAVHAVISRDLGDVQGANDNLAAFTAIKVRFRNFGSRLKKSKLDSCMLL